LPPETAKRLLLQAFIAEVFGDVADEDAKARLEEAALAALEAMI
jgi:Fe-S cluster assembly protein SufD